MGVRWFMSATPLLAAAVASAVTPKPTVFLLQHGHEHRSAEQVGAALQAHPVETVEAVTPARIHEIVSGMSPSLDLSQQSNMHGGFRELGRLVSHLEAMRRASAVLGSDSSLDSPEPIGLILDRPSFDFERYWGAAGLRLHDWLTQAPSDWQMLQLSLVPRPDQWKAVENVPLEVPPPVAWARWQGVHGLHAYAFKASYARYVVRAFYRRERWQILQFMRESDGRVGLGSLALNGAEHFLFSRAVTYSSLVSPLTFQVPSLLQLTEHHTHAGMRLPIERCARAMYEARWRRWLPAWQAAQAGGGGGGGRGRPPKRRLQRTPTRRLVDLRNATRLASHALLRAAVRAAGEGSEVGEACRDHERSWQARDEAEQQLLAALNSSALSGGRLRLRQRPRRGRSLGMLRRRSPQ